MWSVTSLESGAFANMFSEVLLQIRCTKDYENSNKKFREDYIFTIMYNIKIPLFNKIQYEKD
jgi:hypothetical protein